MKKYYFLAALAALMVGCSSPEKRAQRLIKAELKGTLHDWGSYEPVNFGTLDSVYTTPIDNLEYLTAKCMYIEWGKRHKESSKKIDDYCNQLSIHGPNKYVQEEVEAELSHLERITDSIAVCLRTMSLIEKDFTPTFKGWSMQHTFRAKNGVGTKRITTKEFIFDEDISRLIEMNDVE